MDELLTQGGFSLAWPWLLLLAPLPWLLRRWLPEAAGAQQRAVRVPWFAAVRAAGSSSLRRPLLLLLATVIDQNLCLYCGVRFPNYQLSRDHVSPVSKGGQDIWANVVTACKRCNNHKASRTPEEAGMQLI